MSVAQTLRRKTKITITTSAMVSSRVNWTSCTAARMVWVRSLRVEDVDRGRHGCGQPWQCRLDAPDGVDDVGAGLLEDHQEDAALAVRPAADLMSSGPATRRPGRAPQRAAVAIGHDDVVPGLGLGYLVVGIDRVGAGRSSTVPFGLSTVATDSGAADVLERQSLGHQLGRIELDADRPLLTGRPRAPGPTPEIWLICCDSLVSTSSSTSVSGIVSDVAASSRIGESAGFTLR